MMATKMHHNNQLPQQCTKTNKQNITILKVSWQHQVRGGQGRVPREQLCHEWKTTSFISLCAAIYCFQKSLGLFASCNHSTIGLFFNEPFLKSFTFQCLFAKFSDQVHSSCSQGFHVCVLQGFFIGIVFFLEYDM